MSALAPLPRGQEAEAIAKREAINARRRTARAAAKAEAIARENAEADRQAVLRRMELRRPAEDAAYTLGYADWLQTALTEAQVWEQVQALACLWSRADDLHDMYFLGRRDGFGDLDEATHR